MKSACDIYVTQGKGYDMQQMNGKIYFMIYVSIVRN